MTKHPATQGHPTMRGEQSLPNRRPRSLKEASERGCGSIYRTSLLREFLDEFYLERAPEARAQMLSEEPPSEDDDRWNAYLAAVAEHLAWQYRLPVPGWTQAPRRFLKRPFYPCGLDSLKAILLVESPTAFRRRLIFVDADPLYRPRRDSAGIGDRGRLEERGHDAG